MIPPTIKSILFRIGWIITLALYLATAIVIIFQWFVPGHKLLIYFNIFNEALLEFVLILLTLPAVMYFFHESSRQGESY